MIEGMIRIKGKRHFVQAQKGVTALSLFRETGGAIYAPCGGNGTCGKCRMYIKGDVSEPDERERSFLSPRELESGIRLACMCRLLGDFEIVPMDEAMRVQTASKCVSYTPYPILRTKRTENETVFYRDRTEFCRASAGADNLGLAVDVGTTTVAAYLCDMDSGEILSARGFKNPQSAYGADVISRMDKIMKDESLLAVQQKLVCSAIREAAHAMCEETNVGICDVRVAVICGNTVMQHIAAGINPVSISVAPFTAPTLFGEEYDAHALGLLPNEKAIAYFAPCFASYVGGDIACGMIATGL
ncbi:MAG: 2Fe-2S iron-sulfur cluster binding domain-containing protein, partial [Clostridia bacterium]|nr:2Fe-2S iron-sulfur cluster binding domain-containing protein [Clostridia bacterium]